DDPVRVGLVASLNRPGGNATGVTTLGAVMEAKRLGLLRELVPSAAVLGALVDPQNPNAENQSQAVQEAARALGLEIHVVHVGTAREIDTAFTTFVQRRADALSVAAGSLFSNQRYQIATLAAHYRIPTIYQGRLSVQAGGLISYGARTDDLNRQIGI